MKRFMQMKFKGGEVFSIPIDSKRVGFGQIIALPSRNTMIVVIFNIVLPRDGHIDLVKITSSKILFLGYTLDAKLYHNHWTIVGNFTNNLSKIALPYNKIGERPEDVYITDYKGKNLRLATVEEENLLEYKTVIAPIRFEKALKSFFSLGDWCADYDKLNYDRVVELKKIVENRR